MSDSIGGIYGITLNKRVIPIPYTRFGRFEAGRPAASVDVRNAGYAVFVAVIVYLVLTGISCSFAINTCSQGCTTIAVFLYSAVRGITVSLQ